MKNVSKFVLALLICGVCVAFGIYIYNFKKINIELSGSTEPKGQTLHYHFVVLAPDTSDEFWQSVQKGAQEAGTKYGAAVEFNGPAISDENEELTDFDIAIAARVDGIAVYCTGNPQFRTLIDKAVGEGISVVTIESDEKGSRRSSFIGPDTYSEGSSAGSLVVNSTLNNGSEVGIILGGNYTNTESGGADFVNGFKSRIEANSTITLKTVQSSDTGYFGAEEVIRRMLNRYPNINTVVSTNTDDTMEIAQVLIDLNKVGKITFIGYGYSSQMHDYIDNGLVYGSVVEDPELTGFDSVETLVKSVTGKKVPDSINTGVETVTKSNILRFPDNF